MIYFLRRADCDRIKIGTTGRLTVRLKQLAKELGAELTVIAVMDGGLDAEQTLHERFSNLRVDGEWFEPDESLLAYIDEAGREWDGVDEASKTLPIRLDIRASDHARLERVASRRGLSKAAYTRMAIFQRMMEDEADRR